jgi:hypothetical protein
MVPSVLLNHTNYRNAMRRSLEISHTRPSRSPNILLRLSELIFFCGGAINEAQRADASGSVHRFDVSLPSSEDMDTLKVKLWEAGFTAREV